MWIKNWKMAAGFVLYKKKILDNHILSYWFMKCEVSQTNDVKKHLEFAYF